MTAAIKWPASIGLIRRVDFPRKLGLCERLFPHRLGKLGIAWVDTAAGSRWKLDLRNATHRWIVYGKYEGAPFLNWAEEFSSEEWRSCRFRTGTIAKCSTLKDARPKTSMVSSCA